jgi:hypothetical protein
VGNLFVTVGNVELGNSIVSYTTDQKVFIAKTFYCSGGPSFTFRDALSRDTVYWILRQFEETGNVCDKRTKGHKRGASVHMEDVVGAPLEAIIRTPR